MDASTTDRVIHPLTAEYRGGLSAKVSTSNIKPNRSHEWLAKPQTVSFLILPPEIRNKVYELTFNNHCQLPPPNLIPELIPEWRCENTVSEPWVVTRKRSLTTPAVRLMVHHIPALTSTCHQIQEESLPVFFSRNGPLRLRIPHGSWTGLAFPNLTISPRIDQWLLNNADKFCFTELLVDVDVSIGGNSAGVFKPTHTHMIIKVDGEEVEVTSWDSIEGLSLYGLTTWIHEGDFGASRKKLAADLASHIKGRPIKAIGYEEINMIVKAFRVSDTEQDEEYNS